MDTDKAKDLLESIAESNKSHFDTITAHKYDEHPLHAEMAKRIGKSLMNAYPWDEDETTVLDYACGTGLNSRQILPHVKSVTGVDISQAMVDIYNERADNQGMTPEEMRAVCVDLEETPGELSGSTFHVVLCCMSYHHFADPARTTSILTNHLKPGGHLFVADIESTKDRDEIIPESANHIVAHKFGFSETEVRSFFESSGLMNFKFSRITQARKNGKEVNVFIARGVRKSS